MKIKITQEHINKGKKGDSNKCALALALRDVSKRKRWYVGWECFGVDGKCEVPLAYAYLSRKAVRFVEDFENGTAEPCTLILPVRKVLEKCR